MIKLELHVHSHHSFDSLSSPDRIIETARDKGFQGVAITDHNVLRVDWQKLQRDFPDMIIIPAAEIGTTEGDVLAFFISKEITVKEFNHVVTEIHRQDGLAVLAHPFLRGRKYRPEVFEKVDGIEAFNSHNIAHQQRAVEVAGKYNKPVFAGSDAHFLREIGNAANEVDIDLNTARDPALLKRALLEKNNPSARRASSVYFYMSQGIRLLKKVRG